MSEPNQINRRLDEVDITNPTRNREVTRISDDMLKLEDHRALLNTPGLLDAMSAEEQATVEARTDTLVANARSNKELLDEFTGSTVTPVQPVVTLWGGDGQGGGLHRLPVITLIEGSWVMHMCALSVGGVNYNYHPEGKLHKGCGIGSSGINIEESPRSFEGEDVAFFIDDLDAILMSFEIAEVPVYFTQYVAHGIYERELARITAEMIDRGAPMTLHYRVEKAWLKGDDEFTLNPDVITFTEPEPIP